MNYLIAYNFLTSLAFTKLNSFKIVLCFIHVRTLDVVEKFIYLHVCELSNIKGVKA